MWPISKTIKIQGRSKVNMSANSKSERDKRVRNRLTRVVKTHRIESKALRPLNGIFKD